MHETEYRVQLDLYEGPLDLLLYLVRRHELDVMDLPIATITGQFVEYLEVLRFLNVDAVGEFVVTASALLELKGRSALPIPDDDDAGGEPADDPHGDLVARLLDYKRYKDAARELDERAAEWRERYHRQSKDRPVRGKDPTADRLKDVELWDLVSALARVLKKNEVEQRVHIRIDDVPVAVYLERVSERVRREGRTAFSAFFEGENDRGRIVGTFLAILELLRHHGFRAEQPVEFHEIWVLAPIADAGRSEDAAVA
ncbi:MAG: segregation and condensation protein A [Planctomycetaceae bacterium]